MSLHHNNGAIIPAMPEDPFAGKHTLMTMMKTLVYGMKTTPHLYYDQSMVHRWKVNNVPLRPKPENVPEKFKPALLAHRESLNNLFPEKMIDINIGSNAGVAQILRDYYMERGMNLPDGHADAPTMYHVLVVDCNIFDSMAKVYVKTTFHASCLLSVVLGSLIVINCSRSCMMRQTVARISGSIVLSTLLGGTTTSMEHSRSGNVLPKSFSPRCGTICTLTLVFTRRTKTSGVFSHTTSCCSSLTQRSKISFASIV